MKISKFFFSALVFLFFSLTLKAQDSEPYYYIIDYMKVKPGMMDDYLEVEKTWKVIHKERIRQGKITQWDLFRVRFPSGTNTEYDFLTINTVKGWKGVDDSYSGLEEAFKGLNDAQQVIIDKTEATRDLVRTEVWRGVDGVFRDGENPIKYHIINYMDVPTGRSEEYMAMERELVKPVHQAAVKAGDRAGWGLYQLEFPYGADFPYEAATVDFFDNWGDIQSGNFGKHFDKVHPDKSDAYIGRQISETRTLLRSELRVLVDYVR